MLNSWFLSNGELIVRYNEVMTSAMWAHVWTHCKLIPMRSWWVCMRSWLAHCELTYVNSQWAQTYDLLVSLYEVMGRLLWTHGLIHCDPLARLQSDLAVNFNFVVMMSSLWHLILHRGCMLAASSIRWTDQAYPSTNLMLLIVRAALKGDCGVMVTC